MSSDSDTFTVNTECYRANGVYFFSAMLPSVSTPEKLFGFAPALYARLEQVKKQRQDLEGSSSDSQYAQSTRLKSEELMLQQVVEWVKDCDQRNTR